MILSTWTNSLVMSALTGLILGMTTSAAHNFFHQADSWRMYYWDLSFLSSRDWRITHMLSHHLHTNTYKDIEVSGIEPYISFMPYADKNWVQRFFACIYINVIIFFKIIYVPNIVHTGVMVLKNISSLHQNVFLRTLKLQLTFDVWVKNPSTTMKSLPKITKVGKKKKLKNYQFMNQN